ncbi:type IV pilin protein [uncultured Xylophilus sp.]|uniref:type IV pilin protein n=1 Tax=uncultured Xylophilus sp. TaxID=296832 RepID=UPI0025D157A7|nr:prepilin-type N-terminal cleavage/methylation domain-containing protein [uncultured Xylophilus sp.]
MSRPRWAAARHQLLAPRRALWGFTLLEIMLALAALGVLLSIALPSYRAYVLKAERYQTIVDMTLISSMVKAYEQDNGTLPDSLADIGWTKPDKWGNPYYYLKMEGASVGQKRKDRSLHPLNSDYDLYSAGPDGKTTTPLTAKISQDDIIRANDGAFIGVAEDY